MEKKKKISKKERLNNEVITKIMKEKESKANFISLFVSYCLQRGFWFPFSC